MARSLASAIGLAGICLLAMSLQSGCSSCKKEEGLGLKRPDDSALIAQQKLMEEYQKTLAEPAQRSGEIQIEKKVTYTTVPAPESDQAGGTQIAKPKFNYQALDEVMENLQETLIPTVKSNAARLGKTGGAIAFNVVVTPDGKVKQINISQNDLDEQTANAVKAVINRTKFPTWNPAELKEYKSERIKIQF
ncbi:MAG: hypothetical protein RMI34_12795 [Chloroherpetonaceae bacterium]|nr:energy transducer TonB [Chloroherpetonaceae bacterium]MCS7210671.1 energy transducer TonB [Chloroherpetonaceae bacterium]MDW8020936.1 hypothetical protein [Chloroherpetonaceae bacterium]MDW8464845.1 hypothetical protein [Chloroherpetonaceae bacterium]